MAISASQVVSVVPRVINAGASELEITGLYLTDSPICPFPKTLTFPTAKAVGNYFGLNSDEYKASVKYFLGYDNSFKKPSQVTFGRLATENLAGTYIGTGSVAKTRDLQGIRNGAFVISVNGNNKTIYGLDFSGITTQSDIAEKLSNEIQTAKVTYNAGMGEFVIVSNTSGTGSTVEIIKDGGEEPEVIERLGLTEAAVEEKYSVDGEGLWQGEDAERGLVAGWKEVNENWETYKNLFEINENGEVRHIRYEGHEEYCFGSPDATEPVLEKLGLMTGTSWEGALAKTPIEVMNGITDFNKNWVSFTTIKEVDDDTVLSFAEWANNALCEYLYVPYTTNIQNLNPLVEENLPKLLMKGNYEGVYLVYGGIDYATFVMSVGACIDWNRTNGVPTWMFLSQTGLEANVEDDTTYQNCLNMHINLYGNFATRNAQFVFHSVGRMVGGNYGFIDAYMSQIWLRDVLQVALLNGLKQAGRVSYRGVGYAQIRAWCTGPITRALDNGVMQNGVELDETVRAQLYSEVGADVSDEVYFKGYYLKVEDPGPQARVERESPTLGLWYTYGGAVQKLLLPLTVIE